MATKAKTRTEQQTISPALTVDDGPAALDFYRKAFGAKELMRLDGPDGRLLHAEIEIGGMRIMLGDEFPEWGNQSPKSLGGTPVGIHVYVDDVDTVASRAVDAGAEILMPVEDQFYGDRSGRLRDPFGHEWIVSTHEEDVPEEEIRKRAAEIFGQ